MRRSHLEETGFKIEHHEVGKKVRDELDRSKEIEVVEIRSSWTATWLDADRSKAVAKEWERRRPARARRGNNRLSLKSHG